MPIELDTTSALTNDARIRVIGVGGGGGNAINNMINRGLNGVDFITANTDSQALLHSKANMKIQLGTGLGAGANPDVGKKAVETAIDSIKDALKGSDMIFVTAGMGGGTGTGAAPFIAKVGQDLGALVVGIVTRPFDWEGPKRVAIAKAGIEELRQHVDALIVIPNQKILEIIEKKTSFGEAFLKVDEVLFNATRGISDIINCYGVVNVDFADVRTIMQGMGDALMGIGTASGENRATEATRQALNSPLLDGVSINGAKGVLINITGGMDMGMHEISDAVSLAQKAAGEDVNLIHGVVINPDMNDQISVTVVATGFSKEEKKLETDAVADNSSNEMFPGQQTVNIKVATPSKPAIKTSGSYKPTSIPILQPSTGGGRIQVRIPESSPRGEKELRNLDEPAVNRRTHFNAEVEAKSIAAVNTFASNQPASETKPAVHSAFMRRMTDY